ncbi:unnamed protein product [Gordionus sp. m RMFG-2023]
MDEYSIECLMKNNLKILNNILPKNDECLIEIMFKRDEEKLRKLLISEDSVDSDADSSSIDSIYPLNLFKYLKFYFEELKAFMVENRIQLEHGSTKNTKSVSLKSQLKQLSTHYYQKGYTHIVNSSKTYFSQIAEWKEEDGLHDLINFAFKTCSLPQTELIDHAKKFEEREEMRKTDI